MLPNPFFSLNELVSDYDKAIACNLKMCYVACVHCFFLYVQSYVRGGGGRSNLFLFLLRLM